MCRLTFRLSTMLLGLGTFAVVLGWYIDHSRTFRRSQILGEWQYPTTDYTVLGYRTYLSIRADGTFEKQQMHRGLSELFTGTYARRANGVIVFHVTRKETCHIPCVETNREQIDVYDQCRAAVDASGMLLVQRVGSLAPYGDIRLHWETYERR